MSSADQLRRRLSGLRLTTLCSQDVVPEPRAGQLWQLEWDTTALVVLVTAVPSTDSVVVIPAGDPEVGDDTTVALHEEDSPLDGVGYSLWLDLAKRVPTSVLNLYLGDVPTSIVQHVVNRGRRDDEGELPPIRSPLDDRALIRADLEDRLEQLAAATWTSLAEKTVDLSDLARRKGVRPGKLSEVAGIAPGDALAVLNGTRRLSADEAVRAAALFGLESGRLAEASRPTIPADVVALLGRPGRRGSIRRQALRRQIGEGEARREIAEQLLGAAARAAGSGTPDWDTLIDDVLRE